MGDPKERVRLGQISAVLREDKSIMKFMETHLGIPRNDTQKRLGVARPVKKIQNCDIAVRRPVSKSKVYHFRCTRLQLFLWNLHEDRGNIPIQLCTCHVLYDFYGFLTASLVLIGSSHRYRGIGITNRYDSRMRWRQK